MLQNQSVVVTSEQIIDMVKLKNVSEIKSIKASDETSVSSFVLFKKLESIQTLKVVDKKQAVELVNWEQPLEVSALMKCHFLILKLVTTSVPKRIQVSADETD